MKPPHIKEQRQKEVRKLIKKRRELYKQMRELGYDKLEKPIRHGWYKEIVITAKISRYKNNEAILEVFNEIEKEYWGRTKKEADKKWFRHVSIDLIYRDFPTISKCQYNKLSYKAQKLCSPYRFKTWNKKWHTRFYIRIPKNAYRIKYTRAYITHRKRIDPLLESESDLLEQHLEKQEYYRFSAWNYKNYWKVPEYRQQKLKTKRQLNQLKHYDIEDVIKENISWERN